MDKNITKDLPNFRPNKVPVKKTVKEVIYHIVGIILSLIFLMPILYMLATSTKSEMAYAESVGTINMFFIGPANSSLFLFSDIAKNCGWYVSTAIYIPTVCFGAYLLFLLISKLIHPKMKNSGKFPSNQ